MLGHVGINVPDLDAARRYYGAVMPLVGFEIYVDADDEFAYRPMAGKPGAYLFFYPCAEQSQYSRHQTGLQHLAFVVRTRSAVNAVHSVVAELAAQFGGLVLHERGPYGARERACRTESNDPFSRCSPCDHTVACSWRNRRRLAS